jgi:redox-sensitive bicupin YhaK (pirin superfamily)
MALKAIQSILRNQQPHWVGDGFPVRSLFSHFGSGAAISPFLLLDYAGPHEFSPIAQPRGVEQHPHRGFETVTIVYQGELEHRDSAGNHGTIGPGDVQWMTAAAGVIHEEFHSERFAREGGTLEMAQLWVNLPAKFKLSPPPLSGDSCPTNPHCDFGQWRGKRAGHCRRLPRHDGPREDVYAHLSVGSRPQGGAFHRVRTPSGAYCRASGPTRRSANQRWAGCYRRRCRPF